MANIQSKMSHLSVFLGFWMLGGSFISFSAALVFLIGQAQINFTSYLVYTILGAVFLVLGLGLLALNIKKMIANDPTSKASSKSTICLMVLTIILDAVLIIVSNTVSNPYH